MDWKTEFDEKFKEGETDPFGNFSDSPFGRKEIKSFISTVEARAREEAVDYLENQVEAFMNLETRKFGADTTVEEWNLLLDAGRTGESTSDKEVNV